MGSVWQQLDDSLRDWLAKQKLFFVASAPLAPDGLVNVSPKGMDTFRVLGEQEVAYLDLTGSGVETIAHLRENGRIVLMFCAFEGSPRIVRLHGRGEALPAGTPEFARLAPQFRDLPGIRAIVRVRLTRISDSCGFGVPRYAYEGERDTLVRWAEAKGGEAGLRDYRATRNARSVDGLPGLDPSSEP